MGTTARYQDEATSSSASSCVDSLIVAIGRSAANCSRLRALASGAVMCVGSDWPVTTPNPWLELEVGVTRQPPGRPDVEPLDAWQRLDLATAMAAFAQG